MLLVLTWMQKREPAGVRAGMKAEIAPLELQKAVLVRRHTPVAVSLTLSAVP